MAAPRPDAEDETASKCKVNKRKEEHRGEEEQCRLRGREADGGKSALASSVGKRDDGEAGAAMRVPPGVVGTGTSSAPDDSPDWSRQRTGDGEKESRRRMKLREDRSRWSTTAVGGGKSGRWTAQ